MCTLLAMANWLLTLILDRVLSVSGVIIVGYACVSGVSGGALGALVICWPFAPATGFFGGLLGIAVGTVTAIFLRSRPITWAAWLSFVSGFVIGVSFSLYAQDSLSL